MDDTANYNDPHYMQRVRSSVASAQRNAELLEGVLAGQDFETVAKEHGVTRQRVHQIVKRAGLDVRYVRWLRRLIRIDRARRMLVETPTISCTELVGKWGFQPTEARTASRLLGERPYAHSQRRRETDAEYLRLFDSGMSVKEVARRKGVAVRTARDRLARATFERENPS